jgi:hypothetical protein
LALNAGYDSPGEATPATLSSPAVERGVLIVNQLTTSNINTKNLQTPLSGEAEERVPRVALAGESSPSCDLRHFSLQRPPDFKTQNDRVERTIFFMI